MDLTLRARQFVAANKERLDQWPAPGHDSELTFVDWFNKTVGHLPERAITALKLRCPDFKE